MNILYIASIRLPTEKAHGIQIMKMCEAFARIGLSVTLAIPDFSLKNSKDSTINPFEYYEVEPIFSLKRFITPHLIRLGPIGFFLQTFIFTVQALCSKEYKNAEYIFTRDEMIAWCAGFFGKKVIWETHTGSNNFFAQRVLARAPHAGIVAISNGLKYFYIRKGVSEEKIIVAHDAIDARQFMVECTKEEARKRIGLPLQDKIVLYIGKLDGWKGVDTLLESVQYLSPSIRVGIIGGTQEQITPLQKKYPTVIFLGHMPYRDLPYNQKAADVLVIPNSAKNEISRVFTSPLKVFAHMASGVPIVVSDLPSMREVLSERNVFFFVPDNPQHLAEVLTTTVSNPDAASLALQAQMDVVQFTWENRAHDIFQKSMSHNVSR